MTETQSLRNMSIQPGDSKHFKKWETALLVQLAGAWISPTLMAVWRDSPVERSNQVELRAA